MGAEPITPSPAGSDMALDEQTVREQADAYVQALLAGDMELASEQLSDELRSNLGQLVAMLPMPLTDASVESLERTGSGFRTVLQLQGEIDATRLEARWKDRDDRPVIVEVSHLTEDATGTTTTPEDDAASEEPAADPT